MTDAEIYYRGLHDRTLRYAGRVLDQSRRICITADPGYLARREGQAAALLAANLLGRMTKCVKLDFPDVTLRQDGPWPGRSIHDVALAGMRAVDPHGSFDMSPLASEDYRLHLGPGGAPWVAHGAGWNTYVGAGPSPLESAEGDVIFGAAFSVIAAIAEIFIEPYPAQIVRPTLVNTLTWGPVLCAANGVVGASDLGQLWFVGAGSVGSATAYFLALQGLKFCGATIDMDIVKIENLDRSPIFEQQDVEKAKVFAVQRFLRSCGIEIEAEPTPLDQSRLWRERQAGTPDALLAAANERDVRRLIETQLPPVQIYATTGKNWQATLLRHIPPADPCSCCVFTPATPAPTACATATVEVPETGEQVDAALPFLSFAAGLMAAAEIAKLGLPGFPFSENRVFFQPCADDVVVAKPLHRRAGCVCVDRSQRAHKLMVTGSRYAQFSNFIEENA